MFAQKKFRFPYIMYIPDNIESTIMIMHGNNGAFGKGHPFNIQSAIEQINKYGYHFENLNQVVLVPVTSNYEKLKKDSNGNLHEYFPMQASRNVLFDENKNSTYYKLFDQVNNMIDDAKEFIYKMYGIKLGDKIICYGHSSSSKFAMRYTICYPEKVAALIAGGFGAQAFIPDEIYKSINIPYPIGTYDIEKITGKPFNIEDYKKVKQLYYMGSLEESIGNYNTAFYDPLTDKNIQDIYEKVFNGNGLNDRYYKLKEIYKEYGMVNAKFILKEGATHNCLWASDITTEFIRKNRIEFNHQERKVL